MPPVAARVQLGLIATWLAAPVVVVVAVTLVLGSSAAGPFALVTILAGHVLIVCLMIALAGAALARTHAAWAGLLVVTGVAIVVLGSEWLSLPPPSAPGRPITVSTWNLEAGSAAASELVEVLAASDADIVALEELAPEGAAAIEASASVIARYPYRELYPEAGVWGLGLLSRHPLEDVALARDPMRLRARVDLGDAGRVAIVVAHPLPGRIATVSPLRLPVAFDATGRDAALETIRVGADGFAGAGAPSILLGDFNVSPLEPGYAIVARGRHDVHGEVGIGPGWTWRPSRLEGLGMGLLRIDHVFVSPTIEPEWIKEDCSHPGDHCLVTAGVRLPWP
jgi:vancomycin resistance protein VanJ